MADPAFVELTQPIREHFFAQGSLDKDDRDAATPCRRAISLLRAADPVRQPFRFGAW